MIPHNLFGYEPWRDDALCAQLPPEMGDAWFPNAGDTAHSVKAVCGRCPARLHCLDYALTENIQEGIWGGLNGLERRNLRRERKAAA